NFSRLFGYLGNLYTHHQKCGIVDVEVACQLGRALIPNIKLILFPELPMMYCNSWSSLFMKFFVPPLLEAFKRILDPPTGTVLLEVASTSYRFISKFVARWGRYAH
ncbi:hypothetical protein Tco_0700181, partial [Tanacetum coccineum]